jgi:peptidyl-prolyl cis-trans isomerase C
MKMRSITALMTLLSCCTALAQPIVTWKNGQISTVDVAAEIAKLPEDKRAEAKADPAAVSRLLDQLHVYRELARRAREDALENDQTVKTGAQNAYERELGNRYLETKVAQHLNEIGDLEGLAKERFLTSKSKYDLPERRAIAHILIDTRNRTDEDARKKAQTLSDQLDKDPSRFQELAISESDDAGTKARGGSLGFLQRGRAVKVFEDAAFAMKADGEITKPVKSEYGYHILKLVKLERERAAVYDEVKPTIIKEVRDEIGTKYREKMLRELRGDATIKVDDAVFEKLTGATRKPAPKTP